jgi:hypothetical protein
LQAIRAFAEQGDRVFEGAAMTYLALADTDLERAEQEARAAIEALASCPPARAYAMAVLAHVLERAGRAGEALPIAIDAAMLADRLGGIDDGDAFVRLVHAELLRATGDDTAASEVAQKAQAPLIARAERIADLELRKSFLENVPENAATLAFDV